MQFSYDEVRRIHRLEKASTKPVELSPDFYTELAEFLVKERAAYMQSLKTFSVAKTRNFTNLKKMVEEIFALRSKKILGRALVASRTNEASDENLAIPERKMFRNLLSELERHNRLLGQLFAADGKKAKESIKGIDNTGVRILTDIPAFVGADMSEYGPYAKDQTVELPCKVAKLLVAKKFAKHEESG